MLNRIKMEEIVDEIVELVERKLEDKDISLNVQELDEVRDTLDAILENYSEED